MSRGPSARLLAHTNFATVVTIGAGQVLDSWALARQQTTTTETDSVSSAGPDGVVHTPRRTPSPRRALPRRAIPRCLPHPFRRPPPVPPPTRHATACRAAHLPSPRRGVRWTPAVARRRRWTPAVARPRPLVSTTMSKKYIRAARIYLDLVVAHRADCDVLRFLLRAHDDIVCGKLNAELIAYASLVWIRTASRRNALHCCPRSARHRAIWWGRHACQFARTGRSASLVLSDAGIRNYVSPPHLFPQHMRRVARWLTFLVARDRSHTAMRLRQRCDGTARAVRQRRKGHGMSVVAETWRA